MSVSRTLLSPVVALVLASALSASVFAQSDFPSADSIKASTSSSSSSTSSSTAKRTLERPPSYSGPSTNSSSTTRSTSRTTSNKPEIPDPTLFDGSNFPPEKRPERGLLASMEQAGSESEKNVEGDGEKPGGGGMGEGGDGESEGPGGIQVQVAGADMGIPGIPGLGGGGLPGGPDIPGMPSIAAPDALPTLQMGDPGSGDPSGEQGKPGAGKAPKLASKAAARTLQKPDAVQIGDEGAKLAEADLPQADASKQLEGKTAENRMSVKAAAGNQPANRDSGTERGADIPSNL